MHESRRVYLMVRKVVSKFNEELMHWVHMNLKKCIKLCKTNGGNHIESVIN